MASSLPVSLLSEERPSSPHPAFFFVLSRLRLPDLFAIRLVCKSLRDAVDADPLIWRSITVEPPLSSKLTDSILLDITAKARGSLRSLALIDCRHISDEALRQVAQSNPGITKDSCASPQPAPTFSFGRSELNSTIVGPLLHVPGCVGLTSSNIVRVVRMLSNLKCLRLYGLLSITREQINSINSLLQVNSPWPPVFYNSNDDHPRPIDLDICPKCNHIRLVFDCPRASCQEKDRFLCRGCCYCIARCEDCGGCIDSEDLGEDTLCVHLLCSECWLRLPKCMLCNKPSCSRHCSVPDSYIGPDGFICEICSIWSEKRSYFESVLKLLPQNSCW